MQTTQTRASPMSTMLTSALILSCAGGIVALFVRAGRLDWDFAAITQWLLGGLLTGPLLLCLVFGFALVREGLYFLESTVHRDLTGDDVIGRPAAPEPEPVSYFLPTNAPIQQPRYALAGSGKSYKRGDLQHLIHHVYSAANWSGRGTLKGMTLPSGEVLADYDRDVVPFLELLERHGLLVGRGPGVRGTLQGEESGALLALHLMR
jgi:hypothetical protein